MTRIWNWLRDNGAALGGIAALVTFLAFIGPLVAPTVSKWLSPGIRVTISSYPSTMPYDLKSWVRDVNRELFDRSIEEKESPTLKKLRTSTSDLFNKPNRQSYRYEHFDDIGELDIKIENQTDRAISGVRIRLDEVRAVWDIYLVGTFITDKEKNSWQESIDNIVIYRSTVLPPLPALPPGSDLTVVVRGDTTFAKTTLVAEGVRIDSAKTVRVRDSGLVGLVLHPEGFYLTLWLLWVFFLVLWIIWRNRPKPIRPNDNLQKEQDG